MNLPSNFYAEIRVGGKTYRIVDSYSCELFSAKLIKKKERVTLEIEPEHEMIFDSICLKACCLYTGYDRLYVRR